MVLLNYAIEAYNVAISYSNMLPKGPNISETAILSMQHFRQYLMLVVILYGSAMATLALQRKLEKKRRTFKAQCPEGRHSIRTSLRAASYG